MRVGSRMPSDVVASHGLTESWLLLFTGGIKNGIMPADSRAGTDLGSEEVLSWLVWVAIVTSKSLGVE